MMRKIQMRNMNLTIKKKQMKMVKKLMI